MRVFHPGVSRAALGNHRPEIRIGQHIDPRRRRHLAGLKGDDVFASVFGKAAQAVGKIVSRAGAARESRRTGNGWVSGPGPVAPIHFDVPLFRQGPLLIVQDNARRGLQQHAVIVGNLFQAPDEYAAGLSSNCASMPEEIRLVICSCKDCR